MNPFVVTGKILPKYFCDRVSESARLIQSVTNGNNLVLISPRRMGKTGLIQFCFDKDDIKNEYYTFFIDILHTSSLREFTYLLGKEIFKVLAPKSKKMMKLFVQTLKSLSGCFGLDVGTGLPTFSIELCDIERPEYTLEEIFEYLNKADKACIVAIDEFQQISKYPEKNIEALLRTYIQRQNNTHFIYAGSERHMMQEMFLSASRPFYQSADILILNAIDPEQYIPFILKQFTENGRVVNETVATDVYNMFKGHTFYIQKVFNEAYTATPKAKECTANTIKEVLENILLANDTIYREILSNIPENQKLVLYAIAKEREARSITSAQFIKKHKLTSASSVQSASLKLLNKDIITRIDNTYSLNDLFFSMWINTYIV